MIADAGHDQKTKSVVLTAFLLACVTACPAAAEETCPASFPALAADPGEPVNLDRAKDQIKLYYRCAYSRDLQTVAAKARDYIEQRADAVANPALVLDIDETALSNWERMQQNDFGYFQNGDCTLEPGTPCGTRAWDLSERASAIAPILEVFQTARRKNVAVFFLTGRVDQADERAAITDTLTKTGYADWKELVMRSPVEGCDITCFKTNARAAIEAQNYTIIANIGDQWSDLDPLEGDPTKDVIDKGSHAKRIFKLPNPFYFTRCKGNFACARPPFAPPE